MLTNNRRGQLRSSGDALRSVVPPDGVEGPPLSGALSTQCIQLCGGRALPGMLWPPGALRHGVTRLPAHRTGIEECHKEELK